MSEVIFETERLRLRRYRLADESKLRDVFGDDYARTFYPEMADSANVRKWVEWNLRNYEEYGLGLWAMELRPGGVFIGDCGLTYQDVDGCEELEIGYHVARMERGKGYATEAARACLDYGFESQGAEFMCSIVSPTNAASCKVAARVHDHCRNIIRRDKAALLFYTTRGGGA